MGAILSKVTGKQFVVSAFLFSSFSAFFWKWRKQQRQKRKEKLSNEIEKKKGKEEKKKKVAIDSVFFNRLFNLLKILIPGVATKEVMYLVLVTFCLLARTYCDVWLIQRVTTIERVIISREAKEFGNAIMWYVIAMIPVSLVNNFLKFSLSKLSLCFRERLTKKLYDDYLNGFTFYQINNLDNRLANPDQILTQDLEKLCQSLTDLYSNITKPLVDVVVYTYKLTNMIGAQGPSSMLSYLGLSSIVLMILRSPLGKMTVKEQELEGQFRYVNSRLITNSEEIAFYQGSFRERNVVESVFGDLVEQLNTTLKFRFTIGALDQIVGKYLATVVGFYVVSRPFLDLDSHRFLGASKDVLIEEYYQSGRMLLNLAQAVGRLVLAGRELTRLSGFVSRMSELIDVLSDLKEGHYQRTMVENSKKEEEESKGEEIGEGETVEEKDREKVIKKEREEREEKEEKEEKEEDRKEEEKEKKEREDKPFAVKNGKIFRAGDGVMRNQDYLIQFLHVPLVTPNGDILVEDLSFKVEKGVNVLVCGPNGCGKSSLFRVLGELWPLFGGLLIKPPKEKLFYIPQRPYMVLGTLRDNLIYPHSKNSSGDTPACTMTDEELEQLMEMVQLRYLLDRPDGWDAVQDWMDVLSGGEKQRLAMARLFYHQPQFAILDECTSAVSTDVEGEMYRHCRKLGITLFTVSHRRSLWVHHEKVLQFSGRGDYLFQEIGQMEPWGS